MYKIKSSSPRTLSPTFGAYTENTRYNSIVSAVDLSSTNITSRDQPSDSLEGSTTAHDLFYNCKESVKLTSRTSRTSYGSFGHISLLSIMPKLSTQESEDEVAESLPPEPSPPRPTLLSLSKTRPIVPTGSTSPTDVGGHTPNSKRFSSGSRRCTFEDLLHHGLTVTLDSQRLANKTPPQRKELSNIAQVPSGISNSPSTNIQPISSDSTDNYTNIKRSQDDSITEKGKSESGVYSDINEELTHFLTRSNNSLHHSFDTVSYSSDKLLIDSD